jgi:2-methylcitrate dehydratase PrpD
MMAADLARVGITGPRAFLSGVKGFYKAFLQRPPAADAAARFDFGSAWEIRRGGFKRYCCCGANHAAIDILAGYATHLADIESVSLKIPRLSNTMVGTVNTNTYTPQNIEHVQFSLPTQAAFALLGHGNGYGAHLRYLEGRLDMDEVLRVAGKVVLIEETEYDRRYPGKFVTEATVKFSSGSTETSFVENSLGTPDNPMDEASHDTKFLELTTEVLGAQPAGRLLAVLHELPRELGLTELTALAAAPEG